MPPKRASNPKPKPKPKSPAAKRGRAASPPRSPSKSELEAKLTRCQKSKKSAVASLTAELITAEKKTRTARKNCGKSEKRQASARQFRPGGSYVAFYSANFSKFYTKGDKVSDAAKAAGAEWRKMPICDRVKYQLPGVSA